MFTYVNKDTSQSVTCQISLINCPEEDLGVEDGKSWGYLLIGELLAILFKN